MTLLTSAPERSSVARLVHPWNKADISVALLASKPERSSDARLVQPWNILDISVALLASKLERSSDARLVQPWNILDISVAPLASKLERSSDARLVQPWNILVIVVALLAFKPVRSRLVRPAQPLNILDISVIDVVIILAMLIDVNLSQPSNRPARDPSPRLTSSTSEYQLILWREVSYHILTSPKEIGLTPTPGELAAWPKDSTVARFSTYNA